MGRGAGVAIVRSEEMSDYIGRRIEILPEVLVDLTCPLRERPKTGLPESIIISRLGRSPREICDTSGSQENKWPASSLSLGWSGGLAQMRAPLYGVGTTTRGETQQQLRNMVNRVHHATLAAALDQLPETASSPEPGNSLGGQKTRALAKARHRRSAFMHDVCVDAATPL